MTTYYLLKWLHVLGSTVLLGTGAGIAFFMLAAHRTGDARTIAAVAPIVVLADYVFTATAVAFPPITGVLPANEGGGGALSEPSVVAGGLADIAVALGIAWRPTTKLALWAALGVSVFYVAAGTILLPELWADPLGPMMKIWPILAFNLLCLAILDER